MTTTRYYDSQMAKRLERDFRKHMARKVSNSAARTYLLLSLAEHEQGGCCAPITLDERALASSVFVSRNTLTKDLKALAEIGAIEYKPGQAVLTNAKATQVRRLAPAEFNSAEGNTRLQEHTPADAAAVCEVLNGRTFAYDGQSIKPHFAACSTGRIYTSKPNPQHDNEGARFRKAMTGMQNGQFVIEVDYRQADATVMRVLLDTAALYKARDWPRDLYQELATLMGVKRADAKQYGNALFYHPNSRAYVNSLNVNAPRGSFVRDIAVALDEYKQGLWQEGRPNGKRPARITTLSGTVVEGTNRDRRKRIHPGTLLNWRAQGTVADALNAAIRELIEKEKTRGWRVLFPLHDSVLLTAGSACSREVQDVMESAAEERGVPLATKARAETNGSEMSRRQGSQE